MEKFILLLLSLQLVDSTLSFNITLTAYGDAVFGYLDCNYIVMPSSQMQFVQDLILENNTFQNVPVVGEFGASVNYFRNSFTTTSANLLPRAVTHHPIIGFTKISKVTLESNTMAWGIALHPRTNDTSLTIDYYSGRVSKTDFFSYVMFHPVTTPHSKCDVSLKSTFPNFLCKKCNMSEPGRNYTPPNCDCVTGFYEGMLFLIEGILISPIPYYSQ